MDDCKGIGRLLGHKFKPVFDTRPVNPSPLVGFTAQRVPAYIITEMLRANEASTYRCSVCTRCGAQTKLHTV